MRRLLEVRRLLEGGAYFNVDTQVGRLFEARRLLEEIRYLKLRILTRN